MQIAEWVAGMPPEEGDFLRRALKKEQIDARLKGRFYREGTERGYTPGQIKKLWKVMEEFSSFFFSR